MIHKIIQVFGIVQGVGYRYSAKQKAQSLGIKGYVKNMYDGSVFIEAEGTIESLNEFIYWCNHGCSHSRVSEIEVKEGDVKNYKFFDIKY